MWEYVTYLVYNLVGESIHVSRWFCSWGNVVMLKDASLVRNLVVLDFWDVERVL